MRMKIFEFKDFTAGIIISSFLYFMITRQSHDFTETVDVCRNNCKFATKMFVLFKDLNYNERSDEDDDVAKNRYVAKFDKKTSFAFFKSLIVNVPHLFKE